MPDNVSAVHLVLTGDPALFSIVRLSLIVSLSAALFAALIGLPLGALIALTRFYGREAVIVVLNALMGLPPVVAGIAVFLALSRSGPLGSFGLLFTPLAMMIAQTVLVTPIIAALSRQTIEDLWVEYRDEFAAMDVGPLRRIRTLLWDARFSLVTALLAGFGRAVAEVGSIIIVGGNIEGYTRTMTTAIALETSKENLPLALGLGIVLILTVVLISALTWPSGLPFISRGDRSGTHFAELNLWKQSGIDIDNEKGQWYKSIGQGMGAALNTAAASDAYVLSDRATWIRFRNKGDLQILLEGDKRMFNQYGVMLVNPAKHPSVKKELGQRFIDYLVSPEGQNAIANYKIDGQQLFYPNANDHGA